MQSHNEQASSESGHFCYFQQEGKKERRIYVMGGYLWVTGLRNIFILIFCSFF